MEPKKDRFGNGQTTCKACGKALAKIRELNIAIRHKKTGELLCNLWYAPPLCQECGGENSLAISMEWGEMADIGDMQ